MKRTFCLFLTLFASAGSAAAPSSFATIINHYEPVRLALLADSTDGVAEHGRALTAELKTLAADFSPDKTGASHEVADVIQEKLPEMIAAAAALAEAESIEAARDAFYELSVPLVRWQEGMPEGSRPVVAYCSMYKRSWLQPGKEIGNPYGGMPRCGVVVSK